MRTLVLALATAAVAGCTFKSTTVTRENAPPPSAVVYTTPAPAVVYQSTSPTVVYQPAPARAPTIAYAVAGQSQFEQAALQASNWCRTNYRTAARVSDTRRGTSGDVVTFACVPN